jgi:hypothetical protein
VNFRERRTNILRIQFFFRETGLGMVRNEPAFDILSLLLLFFFFELKCNQDNNDGMFCEFNNLILVRRNFKFLFLFLYSFHARSSDKYKIILNTQIVYNYEKTIFEEVRIIYRNQFSFTLNSLQTIFLPEVSLSLRKKN